MFRLNRNRHHLMPMYNFVVGDEDARWEADLLEDEREQQIALNVCFMVLYNNLFCRWCYRETIKPCNNQARLNHISLCVLLHVL